MYPFGQAKVNEEPSSRICSPKIICKSSLEKRSFSHLDIRERTKEKVKAGEKTAKKFLTELKQIKYIGFPRRGRDEYLFFYAPLRNFLNAIFSQAIFVSCQTIPGYRTPRKYHQNSEVALYGGLGVTMLGALGGIILFTISPSEMRVQRHGLRDGGRPREARGGR